MFGKGLANAYADDLRKNFKTYYAAWPPGEPVNLGDYGWLRGNIFYRKDNVRGKVKTKLETRKDLQEDDYKYSSAGAVKVEWSARTVPKRAQPVPNAEAVVTFSKDKAIYFYSTECRFDSISNIADLEKALLEQVSKKKWKRTWAVVTGVLNGGGTTVLIGTGKKSSVTVQASKEIPNLATPEIGLKCTTEENIGLNIVAKKGLTPLLQLKRLKGKELKPV